MSTRMNRFARGFTLVELMIAIVLALLVMLGLLTLINSVGITNRVQDGMARMQENGRYALQRIAQDIRAASSQYCSTFATASSVMSTTGSAFQDSARSAWAHYDVSAGAGLGPAGNTAGYLLNPRWFLFGSECGTTCSPTVNLANRGFDPVYSTGGLGTMGTTAGNRAIGGDVLTLRYLDGPGVPVTNLLNPGGDGTALSFTAPAAQLGLSGNNQQVWLTDCSVSEVLRVNVTGNTLTAAGNFNAIENDRLLGRVDQRYDPRVFNLTRDLRRVSYFLRVNDDPDPNRNPANRRIVSLIRSENGNVQEIVQGVERLDFLYGVEDAGGGTRYLTAAEVDALTSCPPQPGVPVGFGSAATYWGANGDAACGWRGVKSIEVSMLMNTVSDTTVGGDEQYRYSWLNDGTVNATGAYESPPATLRNGLPPYRMLRREFKTLVSLRSYNY